AFLFLLFLAAAEDAAEHVSRAQRDPDTRERVLTDLRLDVVADRAHLVRAEVLGAALQGVPHAVHCSADLAFQATLLFHRARPLLEPGAEPIHPAGQLLLAALDGTGGLLLGLLTHALGLLAHLLGLLAHALTAALGFGPGRAHHALAAQRFLGTSA